MFEVVTCSAPSQWSLGRDPVLIVICLPSFPRRRWNTRPFLVRSPILGYPLTAQSGACIDRHKLLDKWDARFPTPGSPQWPGNLMIRAMRKTMMLMAATPLPAPAFLRSILDFSQKDIYSGLDSNASPERIETSLLRRRAHPCTLHQLRSTAELPRITAHLDSNTAC